MRIFIVGNINVGKSYFIEKLKPLFPNYPVFSIDEYRKKYGDGSIEKENLSKEKFAEDILKTDDCIIEYSGGKGITDLFIDQLYNNSFIVLEVYEELAICLKRIISKDFSKTPYPKFSESIENTIIRLDFEYKSGCIEHNFKDKYLKKYVIHSSDHLDELPLAQYEIAIKVSNILRSNHEYLIAYGSMGRDEMSRFSDVDLYMVSNMSVNQVLELIKYHFPVTTKYILQNNQINIYDKNQLVELTVIKDILDIKRFYSTSRIKNVKKTLLFGHSQILPILDEYRNDNQPYFWDKFEYTRARLEYYCESLLRIIPKNDDYKYYFHTNIVIHEYLRLTYFISGESDFDYLPKRGTQVIGESIFSSMVFKLNESKEKHYNHIKMLVQDLLLKAREYREKNNILHIANNQGDKNGK